MRFIADGPLIVNLVYCEFHLSKPEQGVLSSHTPMHTTYASCA